MALPCARRYQTNGKLLEFQGPLFSIDQVFLGNASSRAFIPYSLHGSDGILSLTVRLARFKLKDGYKRRIEISPQSAEFFVMTKASLGLDTTQYMWSVKKEWSMGTPVSDYWPERTTFVGTLVKSDYFEEGYTPTYADVLELWETSGYQEADTRTYTGRRDEVPAATDEEINRWLTAIVQSCFRFEDPVLVQDHIHLEPTRNVLGQTTGYHTVKPYDHPMWVHSNIDFLQGCANAYVDALEDVPVASTNMLQNIASAYQVLTHFVWDPDTTADVFNSLAATQSPITVTGMPRMAKVELPEIPDHAKNSWLGGRYVFSTAVMDAESSWNYFYDISQQWLGQRSEDIKCHGAYTGSNATFQCTFVMHEKAHEGINAFYDTCYRLGLEPNAYVLWDFIPYSFVFDWFCPVGDTLSAFVNADHYSPLYYDYVKGYGDYSLCYSVQYTVDTVIGQVNIYSRWYESAPPRVETSYILLAERQRISERTGVWRMTDAICLIL